MTEHNAANNQGGHSHTFDEDGYCDECGATFAICGVCSHPWTEHHGEEYARHYLLDNPQEPVVVLLREDMEDILHVIAMYRLPTLTSSGNITVNEV